jgi:hypothetical protein
MMARKPAPPYPPAKPINYVGAGYAGPRQRALPAPERGKEREKIRELREAFDNVMQMLDAAHDIEEARDRAAEIAARLDRPNVPTAHCPHTNLTVDVSGGPVECQDCRRTWLRREDVR